VEKVVGMNDESVKIEKIVDEDHEEPGLIYGDAVVIGSSIGGLTAARVLTKYFHKVTLIDRDDYSEKSGFRRGVPQARHAHTLLPLGQTILERFFPGLVDELLGKGATAIDPTRDVAFYYEGEWRTPNLGGVKISISCSRPLIEMAIYRRVESLPRIHIKQGYEAVGLVGDNENQAVAGVRLRHRHHSVQDEEILGADLVVDASGRNSRAPEWLSSLVYTPPEEWKVDTHVGYATRIYRKPDDADHSWKTLIIRPTPPDDTRGGIILPMEDDRWHVTLIGVERDYPPKDDGEFDAFARSLSSPRLYQAIENAEPQSKTTSFRRTENCVRRYEILPRYLEAFVVLGDAVYAMNPIYAKGMTAAAMGSQTLDRCLTVQSQNGDLTGLSQLFHQQLAKTVGHLFSTTTAEEWCWPLIDLSDNTDEVYHVQ
jgi:2-polyprenyl-6-methoxyphenol hydroxylase-like FAD-dependent oxidoreductase